MSYELSELKKIRRKLGLTQKQLADAANVSQSMIAKIESGRLDPGYTRTKQIFDAIEGLLHRDGLTAKDMMHNDIISVDESMKITDAIKVMKEHGISQIPVMKKGKVVGRISERILLDRITELGGRVRDVMDDAPPLISPNVGGDAVIALLKYFSMVLVAHQGEVKGVITKTDVLDKLYS